MAEVIELFRKAAAAGCARACVEMGVAHFVGGKAPAQAEARAGVEW